MHTLAGNFIFLLFNYEVMDRGCWSINYSTLYQHSVKKCIKLCSELMSNCIRKDSLFSNLVKQFSRFEVEKFYYPLRNTLQITDSFLLLAPSWNLMSNYVSQAYVFTITGEKMNFSDTNRFNQNWSDFTFFI